MSGAKSKVRDHMIARGIETLDMEQTLDVADELLASRRFRHLPVLDAGRVVGVVTERDLFRATLAEAVRGRGVDAAVGVPVAAVMSRPPVTIGPDASMDDAIRLMLDRRVGCLPVVENDVLVGLVTRTDVLRHAAGLPAGTEDDTREG